MMKKATIMLFMVGLCLISTISLKGQTPPLGPGPVGNAAIYTIKSNVNETNNLLKLEKKGQYNSSSFWNFTAGNSNQLTLSYGFSVFGQTNNSTILTATGNAVDFPGSINANTGTANLFTANTLISTNYFKSNGNIYALGNIGVGTLSPTSRLHVKNGIVRSDEGFLLNDEAYTSPWGTSWYGLTKGDNNVIPLNPNTNGDPILLQSFYGLGFQTFGGSMTIGHHGQVTIGLNDTEIAKITDEYQVASMPYKLYVGGGLKSEKVNVSKSNT